MKMLMTMKMMVVAENVLVMTMIVFCGDSMMMLVPVTIMKMIVKVVIFLFGDDDCNDDVTGYDDECNGGCDDRDNDVLKMIKSNDDDNDNGGDYVDYIDCNDYNE